MLKKYKCEDCGEIFNEDEAGTERERVGEFWGAPAYKDFIVCPRCRSYYIEEYRESESEEESEC